MNPITWYLVTITGVGATAVGATAAAEAVIRWREHRRAARLAADPVDEAYDTLPAGRPDQITDTELRRLAPDWSDRIRMPDVPELCTPGWESQAALVRPYVEHVEYVGRHQEDTAGLARVTPDWMPPVGAARLRAALDDTAVMNPVEVDDKPEPAPGAAGTTATVCDGAGCGCARTSAPPVK